MHETSIESNIKEKQRVPIESKHRDLLQAEIMRVMLGEQIEDLHVQLAWADENGKKISEIIDNPANEALRALAREGKYDEAAERVINMLATN